MSIDKITFSGVETSTQVKQEIKKEAAVGNAPIDGKKQTNDENA